MKFYKTTLLIAIAACLSNNVQPSTIPMYICTAASTEFYKPLLNFIGSIHRVNFNELAEIAIFDIGLSNVEKKQLETIEKVKVYPLEMVNPNLTTPYKTRPLEEKYARGWYAWKPVVIKQSLEKFPYILYLDAGATVYKPLDDLFRHILKNGYFLTSSNGSIFVMTTKYVIKKFNLMAPERKWMLMNDTLGIRAGCQGLTQTLYKPYVLPMYELAKDLKNFEDDGTAPRGFGSSRHDQPLFSIFAQLLGLEIFRDTFTIDNKIVQITDQIEKINENTLLCFTRNQTDLDYYKQFIRYK